MVVKLDAVSRNTTHLVIKVKNSGSSKEKKAIDFGVEILTVEELNNLLDYLVN